MISIEDLTSYLEFRDGSVPPLAARPATDDVMALQILRVTLYVPVEILGIVPPDIIRKLECCQIKRNLSPLMGHVTVPPLALEGL